VIQLAVIVVYLVALVATGLWARRYDRGTSSDFMLASNTIGPVLLLLSMFGTTMTAFALVGSSGQAWRMGAGIFGLMASAAGIVHSACFLLIGLPLWAAGRRHGFRTQIQYFRARLDMPLVGLLLFPILAGLVMTYLMLGIQGSGTIVNAVTAEAFQPWGWFEDSGFGVPDWLASAVVCGVVLTYVLFGGMRGTTWANALQTTIFLFIGTVTFLTIAWGVGKGQPNLFESMKAASSTVPESHLTRELLPVTKWYSYLLIPLSVGMFPHVFQHWLTARTARSFKLPVILHPVFVMAVWAPCVMIGIWAAGSGLEFAKPDAVLGKLVQTFTSPVAGGLLSAGIVAASMASLDSQFLCLGTMFSEDVVRDTFKANLSDRQTLWLTRGFIIGMVALTYVLSFLLPTSVFELGIWSFTGFTGLAPVAIAALYWRRVTAPAAMCSILVTLGTWIALFWRSGFGSNRSYQFPETPLALGVFDLPPQEPVLTVFVFSTLTLIVVSLITRPPKADVLEKYFDNRDQRGNQPSSR
jgi:solute:Na+ symporter, SSS family